MNISDILIAELDMESAGTKKVLDRIPESNLIWKPHDKSMMIGRLGLHIAELPDWIIRCLTSEEYNFGVGPYQPTFPSAKGDILRVFDEKLTKAKDAIRSTSDEQFAKHWKLRKGDFLIFDLPRPAVVRRQINHIIHHRGQLTVYLRLLGVPVPGLYGPSADEK